MSVGKPTSKKNMNIYDAVCILSRDPCIIGYWINVVSVSLLGSSGVMFIRSPSLIAVA